MRYNEAYNKIIDAYFKNEISPYDDKFCFCGTLSGGSNWEGNKLYSMPELREMEAALLISLRVMTIGAAFMPVRFLRKDENSMAYHENNQVGAIDLITSHPSYEDALFAGMCAALDVLKQIHIERGEKIDELPAFTKRYLAPPVGRAV